MADPICRWRNPYIATVREFISVLPKTEMESRDFRNRMNQSSFGNDFFRTPYQLACQLGLYYETDDRYYPRFNHDANILEVNSYLKSWLLKYPVPNPFTRQGFDNLSPFIVHSKICEMLLAKKVVINWDDAKMEMFGESIGNDDILINTINTYSEVVQIKNNKLQLKEGVIFDDLTHFIFQNTFTDRNNKKAFFELFGEQEYIGTKSENELLKVIFESKSIRDFALFVFNNFYGQDWNSIISSTEQKQSKINEINFISHDYLVFKRLIAEFESIQTKESLTSSSTLRFFETPILERNGQFYYFSTQWYGTGEYDLSFSNLKKYFETEFPDYLLEYKNEIYSLIKIGFIERTTFSPKSFHDKTNKTGLFFSEKLIHRFIASLCTKPFVILTGLSGSGKTKLAQAFVQWICESKDQYRIIPVGADWTNREPLLGYPNGLHPEEYVLPDSGALQILIEANEPGNELKPYFIVLDEMNLSHVERYFADFLSVMESQKTIKLYDGPDRGIIKKNKEQEDKQVIKNEILWPKNLFILGTVNVDETTYMFSPKVLDRANVIEFRVEADEMKKFLEKVRKPELKYLHHEENEENPGQGSNMAADFVNLANSSKENKTAIDALNYFFPVLQKAGAEFGYRSAYEINRLVGMLESIAGTEPEWDGKKVTKDDFIDIAIMQKLLPKLHGSRNRLVPVLAALGRLCIGNIDEKYSAGKDKDGKLFISDFFEKEVQGDDIIYKLSFDKIKRMYSNVIANGFTSYAEA